jgi:hypothetical protein
MVRLLARTLTRRFARGNLSPTDLTFGVASGSVLMTIAAKDV